MDIYPIIARWMIIGQIESHQERWNVQVLSFKLFLWSLSQSVFFSRNTTVFESNTSSISSNAVQVWTKNIKIYS